MPNWHWIPCLGGRSLRPILERLDFCVRHVAANQTLPRYSYTLTDLMYDFQTNPGGILKVGGSDQADYYPIVEPRGHFPQPTAEPQGKIALVGHSAGGLISRIYCSNREYGGKRYAGPDLVHSVVTLGTPHADAPGPAFESVRWCNQDTPDDTTIRTLAVGGTGFLGNEWGSLTQSSYAFCGVSELDDGDGITPIQSSLAWKGAKPLQVDGVTHFCWSEVAGSRIVAPELTKDHEEGRPWYGSKGVIEQWAEWLDV